MPRELRWTTVSTPLNRDSRSADSRSSRLVSTCGGNQEIAVRSTATRSTHGCAAVNTATTRAPMSAAAPVTTTLFVISGNTKKGGSTPSLIYDARMSDDLPPDGESLGAFLGEIMKMLSSGGGPSANSARDLARSIATQGESEPNIDPQDRIKIEELVRVAELQVQSATQLAVARSGTLRVEVVNRSQWVDGTIEHYQPLLRTIAESISTSLPTPDELSENDPMSQMMAGLQQMLESMLLTMTAGSMVGELARVAVGGFHLPLPRPADAQLLVLLPQH